MPSVENKSFFNTPFLLLLLLTIFLLPLYGSGFNASWHLDDKPNIASNPSLYITDLSPHSLRQTFFANPLNGQKLYRPLPYFSFAMNFYFGGNDPFGFHLVNFGLHVATALALYFVSINLLQVLNHRTPDREISDIHSIALLGAVLWAINPVQTQAVTYIVQRMAVMATFFYALGLLCYIKARTAQTHFERWRHAVCCVFWYFCALGSKENAILLPVAFLLVEWIFFQQGTTDFFFRRATWIAAIALAIMMLMIAAAYTNGSILEFIQNKYQHRPFTLVERLLTQPRVVLGYLSQIFYPLPERFSIAHDVTLSRSLFYPWTTLPAIGTIFGMTVGAFIFAKRSPLTAFAVLFFFINHVTESSIWPLELVFEHRNYLPSLFLFLPAAAGLQQLLRTFQKKNRFMHSLLSGAIIIMMVGIGLSTYVRNAAWATEKTLWTDAAGKAPNSIRPLVTLGVELGWSANPSPADYRHALALFQHALKLPQAVRNTERAEILGNMANIYFHQGNYSKAIAIYHKALEMDSLFLKNRFDLIKPLILMGNFNEAEHHARYLVEIKPNNAQYLNMLGCILLWQNKPDESIGYFQCALNNGPETGSLFTNIGVALTRLESRQNGQWFLQQAAQKSPGDVFPLLALVENRSRANDPELAEFYAERVVSAFPVASIMSRVNNLDTNYRNAPLAAECVVPVIQKAYRHKLTEMPLKTNTSCFSQ